MQQSSGIIATEPGIPLTAKSYRSANDNQPNRDCYRRGRTATHGCRGATDIHPIRLESHNIRNRHRCSLAERHIPDDRIILESLKTEPQRRSLICGDSDVLTFVQVFARSDLRLQGLRRRVHPLHRGTAELEQA